MPAASDGSGGVDGCSGRVILVDSDGGSSGWLLLAVENVASRESDGGMDDVDGRDASAFGCNDVASCASSKWVNNSYQIEGEKMYQKRKIRGTTVIDKTSKVKLINQSINTSGNVHES